MDHPSEVRVQAALRSDQKLVIITAPAGCGKTHQASKFVSWRASVDQPSRTLVLTHTNAAVAVFRDRIKAPRSRVEISTIHGLAIQIASPYHEYLGLPKDLASWGNEAQDNFDHITECATRLIDTSSNISGMLATRFPFVICDEHQDSTKKQHEFVMSLHRAGSRLRVFTDPMQAIYIDTKGLAEYEERWASFRASADINERLEIPRRWEKGSIALGAWILKARDSLEAGLPITLPVDLPDGLRVLIAKNVSPSANGYRLSEEQTTPVRRAMRGPTSQLILTPRKIMVQALHAWSGRAAPIWEGHSRDALSAYAKQCANAIGNPAEIAKAVATFVQATCVGFTGPLFACLVEEAQHGCIKNRTKRPAQIQKLASLICDSPNHLGAALALKELKRLIDQEPNFRDLKIYYRREFYDAIRLGEIADITNGLALLAAQRRLLGGTMPSRAVSTIHKAKGLECDHAIVIPCDAKEFPDSPQKRRLLYVALSRAVQSLTLVICPDTPTTLIQH